MRLGDLDALKKVLCEKYEAREHYIGEKMLEAIDNAPTVAVDCKDCDGYEAGYSAGLKDAERPQGECKTCIHRDPEDKKCDCGGQERQGCPFPVSDDYFCKFYEKGGAE